MKNYILVSTLVLAMATTLSAWANESHQLESCRHPAIEMTQEKIKSTAMGMKESRLKLEMAINPKERQALMYTNMQHMKDGMKMMEMMKDKDMMRSQDDHYMEMIEMMRDITSRQEMIDGKMEIMMEMMRGLMIQLEIMMKINNLISI